MRLTAAESTVTLKNADGKALSARDGMRLYSGYTITTGSRSYAYITLDSTKVVKLEANAPAGKIYISREVVDRLGDRIKGEMPHHMALWYRKIDTFRVSP